MSRYRGRKESVITLFIAFVLMILCFLVITDFRLLVYTELLISSAWFLYVFGGANLLSPITLFYLMYLFFIALGPYMYYIMGMYFDQQIYFLIEIALFMLIAGYCIGKTNKRKIKVRQMWVLNIENYDTVILVCNCIIIMSIILKVYYLVSNRALLFSGSLNSGRIEASFGNGLISYGGNMWSPAACIIFEIYLKGKKIKKINWILIGFAFVLGLFSGFRTGLVAFALTIVLMINKKRKIPALLAICLGIAVLLFLFIYEIIREAGNLETLFDNNAIINLIAENAYVGTINIRYILNAFPENHVFLYGYGYLINILMLLPGPDLDFTLTLKQILGLSFGGGGVTPTIIGEFYLNFGITGVFIGMFLSGVILMKIEKLYQESNLFYISSFLMVEFIIAVRSGFANIEITLMIYGFVYLLVSYVSHHFKVHI